MHDDDQQNEPFTREEEEGFELRLDEAQEQRQAEEEKAAETSAPDDEECNAEFIDGSRDYENCGCDDCREALDREHEDCNPECYRCYPEGF